MLSLKDGFGFIQCPEYPNNVFFHWNSFDGESDNLAERDKVIFEPIETERGPQGKNVRKN